MTEGLSLTPDDLDQIIEGIEQFIIGEDEDGEIREIWQPYLDKLTALRDERQHGASQPVGEP